MAEEGNFKCLRCGHVFVLKYTPGVAEEKTCPNCASNSVRIVKDK